MANIYRPKRHDNVLEWIGRKVLSTKPRRKKIRHPATLELDKDFLLTAVVASIQFIEHLFAYLRMNH
jgi:hypothetical protein